MKTKLLVVVSGGVVQTVLSSSPDAVEVVLFDYDNLGDCEGLLFAECAKAYTEASAGLAEIDFEAISAEAA